VCPPDDADQPRNGGKRQGDENRPVESPGRPQIAVEQLVGGPQAPAPGAFQAEQRPEQTGRIEAVRRRIEKKEDYGSKQEDEGDRRPSDTRAPKSEDAGPPATPARTV